MTFLLFLASLAVVEYLTRKAVSPAGAPPKERTQFDETTQRHAVAQPTHGLAALSQVLEEYGRGNTPGTVPEPLEVHNSQLDRL